MADEFNAVQAMDKAVRDVILRTRLDRDENLLKSAPTQDEIKAAVLDSLDQINANPPETQYTFEWVCSNGVDTRWYTLMIIGAARNVIFTIMSHWTHEGEDVTIGDLNAHNRLSDYQALHDKLSTEFDERLEKLKTASQKYVKGAYSKDVGVNNILYPFTSYTSVFASRVRIR